VKITCRLCPHFCGLDEGQTGLCRARANKNGEIVSLNYGRVTALALDPIEKKPLKRFMPGRNILSVGSFGCNLRCPFCQNSSISMAGCEVGGEVFSPERLVDMAVKQTARGNVGLAYTYNEPLVGYEFVRDCAALIKKAGLKNVLVTNGMINSGPWHELLPLIDAANVDLKGFSQEFYDFVGGDFKTVKQFIEAAAGKIHLEVTTLIIPGKNDGEAEMGELAGWLAELGGDIPLHISRFFPQYNLSDLPPTPLSVIDRLVETAREHLRFVYRGNC
jgi:pyruvate formate lyase activating enzyme